MSGDFGNNPGEREARIGDLLNERKKLLAELEKINGELAELQPEEDEKKPELGEILEKSEKLADDSKFFSLLVRLDADEILQDAVVESYEVKNMCDIMGYSSGLSKEETIDLIKREVNTYLHNTRPGDTYLDADESPIARGHKADPEVIFIDNNRVLRFTKIVVDDLPEVISSRMHDRDQQVNSAVRRLRQEFHLGLEQNFTLKFMQALLNADKKAEVVGKRERREKFNIG